jgi:hypothetical protein
MYAEDGERRVATAKQLKASINSGGKKIQICEHKIKLIIDIERREGARKSSRGKWQEQSKIRKERQTE